MVNFAFSVKCQRCRGQAAAFKGSARMHEASLLMIFRQIFFVDSCRIMLPGIIAFRYIWVYLYKVPELCFRHWKCHLWDVSWGFSFALIFTLYLISLAWSKNISKLNLQLFLVCLFCRSDWQVGRLSQWTVEKRCQDLTKDKPTSVFDDDDDYKVDHMYTRDL